MGLTASSPTVQTLKIIVNFMGHRRDTLAHDNITLTRNYNSQKPNLCRIFKDEEPSSTRTTTTSDRAPAETRQPSPQNISATWYWTAAVPHSPPPPLGDTGTKDSGPQIFTSPGDTFCLTCLSYDCYHGSSVTMAAVWQNFTSNVIRLSVRTGNGTVVLLLNPWGGSTMQWAATRGVLGTSLILYWHTQVMGRLTKCLSTTADAAVLLNVTANFDLIKWIFFFFSSELCELSKLQHQHKK